MILSSLAERYLLASQFCRWAEARGGRDAALAEAERIVQHDPDNDLDFVVMEVLGGNLEELTTRSMVRGLVQLGLTPEVSR